MAISFVMLSLMAFLYLNLFQRTLATAGGGVVIGSEANVEGADGDYVVDVGDTVGENGDGSELSGIVSGENVESSLLLGSVDGNFPKPTQ